MFKTSFILVLILLLNCSFSFNNIKVEKRRTKKRDKAVENIWNNPTRIVPLSISMHDHGLNMFEAVVLNTDTVGIIFSGRVFSCRSGGCDIKSHDSLKEKEPAGEYFDVFMIFNMKNEIQKVEVYSYKATHGHAVAAKSWLKQFIDYDGGELRYGKDIDALSGATISAENLTSEVERVTGFLNNSN